MDSMVTVTQNVFTVNSFFCDRHNKQIEVQAQPLTVCRKTSHARSTDEISLRQPTVRCIMVSTVLTNSIVRLLQYNDLTVVQ